MVKETPLVIGAFLTAVLDAAIEAVWASNKEYWTDRFPFVPTIGPLPPADDWIVLGVPAVVAFAGTVAGEDVASAGIGGLLYAGPMMVHHTIVKSVEMLTAGQGQGKSLNLKSRAKLRSV